MLRILSIFLLIFTAPARAEVPTVVTDIPAVHSLVAQVMQGVGAPEILLDKGSNPHSFQMRPSQAQSLSQADLVFFIGPELTPWLERAIDGVGVRGKEIELLEVEGTVLRMFEELEEHEEKLDEQGHEEHNHDGLDPHAWLTPKNAIVWLDVIAAELAEIDPDNSTAYHDNANVAKQRIQQLDTEIAALLVPMKDVPIIVFHDAYGYFADHYGLYIASAIRKGDAATPGAAHLMEVREVIAKSGIACAFGEEQHDPALLNSLSADANINIGAALDPAGSSLEYGPELYGNLIRKLALDISQCQRE